MDTQSIVCELEALLGAPPPEDASHLGERVEALGFLDFAIEVLHEEHRLHDARGPVTARSEREVCTAQDAQAPQDAQVAQDARLQRAEALRRSLRAANRQMFAALRAQIRTGRLPPAAMRRILDRYTAYRPGATGYRHRRFESLDTLVAGTLLAEPIPQPTVALTPEMIIYQASPASVVLELVDRTGLGPGDVFYDLGAGLGQVVLLAALLSGTRARGIEIEPAYCDYARRQASDLGLAHIAAFEAVDARGADYHGGTVFYLFTPFTGALLAEVLARIREQTRGREVLLASFGPCTPVLAREGWLRPLHGGTDDGFRLALFARR